MLWFYFAILAYFLFAFSSLTDRYLLAGPLPHPRAFAFYTGITGILAIVLVPFAFEIPELWVGLLALATGVVGVLGLYASYRAVYYGGVSKIVPMVAALFPLFTLALSRLFFAEEFVFSTALFAATTFFVLGATLLSLQGNPQNLKISWFDLKNSFLVAFLFAFTFVLTKTVYEQESFLNGFMWMRWGGFLASVSLLAFPLTRKLVFQKKRNPAREKSVYLPFLLGKIAGSSAFLLQQLAINFAKPFQLTVVSAMQGVQYAFLLIFVAVLAVKNPKLLKEEFTGANRIWRITGVVCIVVGFITFAFYQ